VCAVYISKIMHNGVKAGELQINQNSSDTVIFAVPKNISIDHSARGSVALL